MAKQDLDIFMEVAQSNISTCLIVMNETHQGVLLYQEGEGVGVK